MAENDDKVKDKKVEDDEPTAQLEEIARLKGQVEALQKHEGASEQLAGIIADPDVREMLRAKQEGQEVRILVGDEEDDKDKDKDKDKDLDEMSRTELVEFMIDASAKASAATMDEKLEPIAASLASLTGNAEKTKAKELKAEISKVKEKHSDFDTYKKDIIALEKDNPGLRVEEYYQLARIRKGVDITKKVNPASEKPSSTSARPSGKTKREKPIPATSRGFGQLIDEALAKVSDDED